MDYSRIAQIFIDKIKAEYGEDIAAVVLYGPEESDETLSGCYFVPKTERGAALGRAFLIKEHGVYVPSYTWTELAQCSKDDRRNVNLLLDAKLLYSCSEEDTALFESLRRNAENFAECDKQLENLIFACKELYFTFYEPCADAAAIAIEIAEKISCALLLYNGSYRKREWNCLKEEVLALPQIPQCYAEVMDQLIKTADPQLLKGMSRKLIMQTQELVMPKTSVQSEKLPAQTAYTGVYEQAKILYEKITDACFNGKSEAALLYADSLQKLLDEAAERSQQTPQLKNLLDLYYRKDLTSFAVSLYSHEASLIGFLLNLGIEFEQYPNMERFEEVMLPKESVKI